MLPCVWEGGERWEDRSCVCVRACGKVKVREEGEQKRDEGRKGEKEGGRDVSWF